MLTFSTSENAGKLGNQQGSSNNQNENDNLKYWVAGFIEGEGSFNTSFKLNAELRMGIQVAPEFSVTQHKSGKQSLEFVKQVLLGAGSEIKAKGGSPDVLVYTVTNIQELNTIVIPFLKKYNTYSARWAEMQSLFFVCEQIANKKHLTKEGMTHIIDRVFDTPLKKGNRQLSKPLLLSVLGNQRKVAELILIRRKGGDIE